MIGKCTRSDCSNKAKHERGLCQPCLDKLPKTQLDRIEDMLKNLLADRA